MFFRRAWDKTKNTRAKLGGEQVCLVMELFPSDNWKGK
jgi:hypothetical protein